MKTYKLRIGELNTVFRFLEGARNFVFSKRLDHPASNLMRYYGPFSGGIEDGA